MVMFNTTEVDSNQVENSSYFHNMNYYMKEYHSEDSE